MKMIKKWLALVLAILMIMTMASCGKTEEPQTPDAPVTDPTDAPVENKLPGATWDGYAVQYQGAEMVKDYGGNDALRIYYDFTNNSDEGQHAHNAVRMGLTQDGAELKESGVMAADETEYYGNESHTVRPGVTIRGTAVYALSQAEGSVHVKMYNYYNDETDVLEFDVDLANLPGKPEQAWTITPVTDPKNVTGLTTGGVVDEDYEVTIDGIEKAKGYDGEDLVRVLFTFTNNSDDDEDMWTAAHLEVFQDNIEMMETTALPEAESDDAFYADVAPGQTVKTSVCYILRTDSPIEVEIGDGWSVLYGARFDVK